MKNLLLAVLLMAAGAFLWWAFSPLLFDKEVNDELDPELQARLEAQKRYGHDSATAPQSLAASPFQVVRGCLVKKKLCGNETL